jgi:two-component system, NarL family, nitrate/nitrite response regulator NarL
VRHITFVVFSFFKRKLMSTVAPFRVLIADDHMLVREGIKTRLSIESDFEVIGEAIDGNEAVSRTLELQPDLLLVDLDLPYRTGVEVAAMIKRAAPSIKIVVLTGSVSRESMDKALDAGANGFVTKKENDAEMLQAFRTVLAGKSYISANVADLHTDSFSDRAADALTVLSEREREVLSLVASGYSANAIADKLGVALGTVRKHRENFMNKLDLRNTAELTAFTIKCGLYRGHSER